MRPEQSDRILPVLGCVADVVLFGPDDARKAPLQRHDHSSRVVDRQRRLRNVRQVRRIAHLESLDSGRRLDQIDPLGGLTHCAFDLGVAGVADHDHLAPQLAHLDDLDMHLGDQGAGRVEHPEPAPFGFGAHRPRHAVRAEDHRAAGRNVGKLIDEDRALALQALDDKPVVHHLVAHIDRCAELRERLLDDGDGAIDTGTETTRIGEQDIHDQSVNEQRQAHRGAGGNCRRSAMRRRP